MQICEIIIYMRWPVLSLIRLAWQETALTMLQQAADLGLILAEGTDLSMEAGDIVIVRGGIGKIIESIKAIKTNVERAMTLSAMAVVMNSLAISGRRYKRTLDKSTLPD